MRVVGVTQTSNGESLEIKAVSWALGQFLRYQSTPNNVVGPRCHLRLSGPRRSGVFDGLVFK